MKDYREKIAERIEKFMLTPKYSHCADKTTPADTMCNMFNIVYADTYKENWKKENILECLSDYESLEDLIDNLSTLKKEYIDRAISIEKNGVKIAPKDMVLVHKLDDILENDIPKILSQLELEDNTIEI